MLRTLPGSYLSRAALLSLSSMLAQGVQLLGALAVARLYGPVEVGVYGLFMAISGFAQIASSWRYELAIVTVDDEAGAHDAAFFVVVAGAAAMIVGLAVVGAFGIFAAGFGLSAALAASLMAVPPTI